MTEQTTGQRDTHPADLYRGVYSQPYNEIVHPSRVWTVSKYFLRRWAAYLSPPAIWLVIGARQLSYLNRRRPWFAAYDSALAAAAGLNVDVFRRTLKREITDQEGPLAHFLSKEADPAYVVREGSPRKGRTRYHIRLDDPLTPADAAALANWLRRRLAADADTQAVINALQEARKLEPRQLWATDLAQGQEQVPQARALLSVADVVRHVLPHLNDTDAPGSDNGWETEADALHTHLVAGEIVHLEPHYFREQWLPLLGAGPALLIVNLRSLCFLNEETGEIRDVVHTEAGELAQRMQTTRRTLRRWFNKLEEAATHDTLFGPFFTFLENNKQPDQRVIATYRINLKMPLTPDDFERYRTIMAAGGPSGEGPAPADDEELADKKSATEPETWQKVTDKRSATKPPTSEVSDKKSGTSKKLADKKSAAGAGRGQNIGNEEGGDGQKVAASATKRRPFKDYKRLLTALNLKDFAQLEQRTEQQYQHLWHIRDGQAPAPFAVVVAGGSLANLLDLLGIQEPARTRILQRDPPPSELLAWHLYAQRQSNLDQPVAYVVARALEGDKPPQPFLRLAALSWEQWRAYATVSALALHLLPGDTPFEAQPCFRDWFVMYGGAPPESLPFQVGAGLASFRIDRDEEVESTPATSAIGKYVERGSGGGTPATNGAGDVVDRREESLWQETLSELALQMTQSTFDAWLRRARFVSREEQTWVIAVDNPAAQGWLQNRLLGVVERTLSAVVGEAVSVQFVVGAAESLDQYR